MSLVATDLVAGYRQRRRRRSIVAVKHLAAPAGELTAVVGPNGGGKSTLLRTLVGAQRPLHGRVEIDGHNLARLDRRQRARHLAVVLTDRLDPGRLTAGEVVALGRHPHTAWTGRFSASDVAAARRAADLVGIAGLWAAPFDELSDGQRQRVLVARALAQDPALVVLDEPTAYLDLPGRAALTASLAHLTRQAGVAVVLSTHDLDLALAHADQLWLVHDGTVGGGAPEDLLHDGRLAAAFDRDGLVLDPGSATMRPPPAPGPRVTVRGDGLPAQLAARAARRLGFRVTRNGCCHGRDDQAPWELSANAHGWTLRQGAHTQSGMTFAQLARALRSALG